WALPVPSRARSLPSSCTTASFHRRSTTSTKTRTATWTTCRTRPAGPTFAWPSPTPSASAGRTPPSPSGAGRPEDAPGRFLPDPPRRGLGLCRRVAGTARALGGVERRVPRFPRHVVRLPRRLPTGLGGAIGHRGHGRHVPRARVDRRCPGERERPRPAALRSLADARPLRRRVAD